MTQITNADGKLWMALAGRLNQWTECKVMYPMEDYHPTATDTFVIVQNVSTEYGGPVPVNPKCGIPFTGFLSLGVCVPTEQDGSFAPGMKYSWLVGLAGRLADHFEDGMAMRYDDITVRVNGRARVSGNVSLQAPWNRLEVTVPWKAWG